MAAGPPQATTCADLANALAHLDRKVEAVAFELKDYARAALEHYVEVFPQDTFMRKMLEQARAQPGQ